ncbi:MAG: HEPN domain-containing protein, partial [Desulfurococcales archaeon]|nr:HEPN domain-containing protein [Desulfurococcales archaeon]
IASQLAIKSLIIKLGFEPPRTHRIRRLLSFIIENKLLDKDLINKLQVFIKTYRRDLIILERAREAGQYGSLSVDKEEAEIILNIAREVVRIAKELWSMAP